jgi:hypothetical protein
VNIPRRVFFSGLATGWKHLFRLKGHHHERSGQ